MKWKVQIEGDSAEVTVCLSTHQRNFVPKPSGNFQK